MNFKKWISIFIIELLGIVILSISFCIIVDPFFHYHKPLPQLFYVLNNERYQNDGILKHFSYDAIITGTSMAENFKTSEFDKLFNVNSIKVPFSGGTFKEMNDNIATAFRTNHQVKYVVRSLDTYKILSDKDEMRNDLGNYPEYLYNDNWLDDFQYFLNVDVAKSAVKIIRASIKNKEGGITSFDEYANWNNDYKFGKEVVLKNLNVFRNAYFSGNELTVGEKKIIQENIKQNVTDLAYAHPETTFYYFFPPYSVAYWGELHETGQITKNIEIEQYAIELILECPNIKLFSFNTMADITMDLNNYKDTLHYGEWINSKMLEFMKNDVGLLTKENYKKYIEEEKSLYLNYPYNDLFKK